MPIVADETASLYRGLVLTGGLQNPPHPLYPYSAFLNRDGIQLLSWRALARLGKAALTIAATTAPNWKQISRNDAGSADATMIEDRVVDEIVKKAMMTLGLAQPKGEATAETENIDSRITDALALP
eukprot:416021-Amphidinium_carterae.2